MNTYQPRAENDMEMKDLEVYTTLKYWYRTFLVLLWTAVYLFNFLIIVCDSNVLYSQSSVSQESLVPSYGEAATLNSSLPQKPFIPVLLRVGRGSRSSRSPNGMCHYNVENIREYRTIVTSIIPS